MFRQSYDPILVLVCLISIISSTLGGYFIEPVLCRNATVFLKYSKPLPSANSSNTITTEASDSNVWSDCQLGALKSPITYYLTLTATNANCEKATFTNFVFTGFFNCSTLWEEPARAKNLTVPLSDPDRSRNLSEVQPFEGPIVIPISVTLPVVGTIGTPISLTVLGFKTLYAVNFTFIFPENNHKPGKCNEIVSEEVKIIPQLFLINIPNYSKEPIIPPAVDICH